MENLSIQEDISAVALTNSCIRIKIKTIKIRYLKTFKTKVSKYGKSLLVNRILTQGNSNQNTERYFDGERG